MPHLDGFMVAEQIHALGLGNKITLMMLSSLGPAADIERLRTLGVAAWLTKPIKQTELFCSLRTLLADTTNSPDNPATDGTPMAAVEPTIAPLKILVAEDNPINQRVARGILEKRGHTVVVVENGQDAVQATATERFDLILMDVQMPVLDGLQATQAIRRWEGQRGGHIPIIAMTAYAMKSDEERCLHAGMDAYLAKPIHPQTLLATIGRVVSVDGRPATTAQCPAVAPSPETSTVPAPVEVIDFKTLSERLENDWQLLDEMVGLFLSSTPMLLEQLEAEVSRGDCHAVQCSAHALKGALQSIQALPAARSRGYGTVRTFRRCGTCRAFRLAR